MEHIISVLVENKFGVLARVAGLFSARGYNIESLSVAPTLDPTTSMITIVTVGDDRIIEQIMKQLNKVVEVLKVVDLTEMRFLDRETALIKVHTKPEHRDEAEAWAAARAESLDDFADALAPDLWAEATDWSEQFRASVRARRAAGEFGSVPMGGPGDFRLN